MVLLKSCVNVMTLFAAALHLACVQMFGNFVIKLSAIIKRFCHRTFPALYNWNWKIVFCSFRNNFVLAQQRFLVAGLYYRRVSKPFVLLWLHTNSDSICWANMNRISLHFCPVLLFFAWKKYFRVSRSTSLTKTFFDKVS